MAGNLLVILSVAKRASVSSARTYNLRPGFAILKMTFAMLGAILQRQRDRMDNTH